MLEINTRKEQIAVVYKHTVPYKGQVVQVPVRLAYKLSSQNANCESEHEAQVLDLFPLLENKSNDIIWRKFLWDCGQRRCQRPQRCQKSIRNAIWNHCSLSFWFPSAPTLPSAHAFATQYIVCLCLPPQIVKQKRDCLQSRGMDIFWNYTLILHLCYSSLVDHHLSAWECIINKLLQGKSYAGHLLDFGFGNYFFHDLFLTLVFFCNLNYN